MTTRMMGRSSALRNRLGLKVQTSSSRRKQDLWRCARLRELITARILETADTSALHKAFDEARLARSAKERSILVKKLAQLIDV